MKDKIKVLRKVPNSIPVMALKNYSTDVPVAKTVSEIHVMLAEHKAKKIMFDYAESGELIAVCFIIPTPNGGFGVKLPANIDRVREVLRRQKAANKGRTTINDSREQAARVAWRIVKDWLSSQLAILETEMVDVQQVFFTLHSRRQRPHRL